MTDAPSRQLLLVNDDEAKRYVLGAWMRQCRLHGYRNDDRPGGTGPGGGTVDLVLLDVNLPDISGFDIVRQIKAERGHGCDPGDPGCWRAAVETGPAGRMA